MPQRLQSDYSDVGLLEVLVPMVLRNLGKLDSLQRTRTLPKRLPAALDFPGGSLQTGPPPVYNEFGTYAPM